jgi:hypothetical protein
MNPRWSQGLLRRAITLEVLVVMGFATLACASGGNGSGSGTPDASPAAGAANVTEKTAKLGESIEVAGFTSTVTEVHRQQSFGANAEAGYVVAQVTTVNSATTAQDYHRLQWQLRFPDGSSTNRTPIAGQTQLGQGELQPGEQVSGSLIFTVEQKGGEFAVVFEPRQDDEPERERGLWPFTSQPGEAR